MPLTTRPPSSAWRTLAMVSCAALLPVAAQANATERVGRYLDRSVLVHEAAQLNPLEQVADLEFSSRITVSEALRLALAGTGYDLLDPDSHPDPESRKLLRGRIAIPHESFSSKRIDSVIAALVGAGRGYHLQVDHLARLVRVVPVRPAAAMALPAPMRTAGSGLRGHSRYLQHSGGQLR